MRASLVVAIVLGSLGTASAQVSPIIYLERCKGNCTVRKGPDDARAYTSTIPQGAGTEFTLTEFKNTAGESGPAADDEWNRIVQCVKEVYSPFGAIVTDVKPTAPTYHMNIVAGLGSEVGQPQAGGISPGVDCQPADNRITFTFANGYRGSNIQRRIWMVCSVIAQETAHTFTLDHSWSFGNMSACRDPMTYRGDCGGQKFFRNELATCGEYGPNTLCACGPTQNAHQKLLTIFGPGTPITAAPEITLKQPANGATIAANTTFLATAGAQRGIAKVELWINGYKWGQALGAAWGADGQPTVDYGIPLPAMVPDGVMDVVLKAKDDIDVTTETPMITVTKGAPCTSADTCLEGQKCEEGRCFWDEPTGELGDPCDYPQFCTSEMACTHPAGSSDGDRCTRSCVIGVADSCDEGYTCVAGEGTALPICWPGNASGDDGICSAGDGHGAPASIVIILFGLAFVLRRRR